MTMKRKPLGYYDYTVILTYCGMLCAFCGILRVIAQDYRGSVICLMLAGICDMFDGAVAATKMRDDKEKRFGIQIDSLSDLISFGVLPGIFVCIISGRNIPVEIIATFYVLCALIRLAYFNVLEEDRQKETDEKRKSYLGVPVTTVAIMLPLVYALHVYGVCKSMLWFPLLLLVMGMGFLMPVKVKKPDMVGKLSLVVLTLWRHLD